MTVSLSAWLDERREGVPETLWNEVRAAVDENVSDEHSASASTTAGSSEALDRLTRATRAQMERMRTRPCTRRGDALTLLATDAMVTYTMELAALVTPAELDYVADEMMRAVAGEASSATPGGDAR